jgi:DNA (cytosine-5)-methyltransferase 1
MAHRDGKPPLTFADMFCGIGGVHLAAARLGMNCVFACDIDAEARRAYQQNFHIVPAGDITEIDPGSVPDHEILLAGFPCQPPSIIGEMRGFDDSRGNLIFDVAAIIDAKRPSTFVLENVRQLLTHNIGRTIEAIISALNGLGYRVDWNVLNALDFGLPQKRERTIIVGFKDHSILYKWPDPIGE